MYWGRPEDLESRAPHALELEITQSEPRTHRNGPNADDDEPLANRLETSLKSSYQEKCSFPRTPQEEWMTKLRSLGRNLSTKAQEEHETSNENPVPPSPIRPIYVRKVKRGPLSVLAAELRYFLPEQCVRDLSFYGKDCLGMRVEESMEQFTGKILIHLGYQPVKGKNRLSFNDRQRNADNQDFVDRCIAGAMIRWKRGPDNNPHKPARAWYRTQLDRVAQRYPYIARDVL